MDHLACSTGGLVFMDFRDPAAPLVRRLDAALPGYVLCVVDSGADHAGLTDAYAAIPRELGAVCRLFGAEVLRQVEEAEFYRRLPEVRRAAGDRAVLRAIHVFDENRRVLGQVQALENGDTEGFWPWSTTPAAPPGNICRTSPRRGPPGIRRWPCPRPCAAACCGAGEPAGYSAAASRERPCAWCRRRIIPPSGRSWRASWPPAAATG